MSTKGYVIYETFETYLMYITKEITYLFFYERNTACFVKMILK